MTDTKLLTLPERKVMDLIERLRIRAAVQPGHTLLEEAAAALEAAQEEAARQESLKEQRILQCDGWEHRALASEARAEQLAEALRKAREDINWMLNSQKFLNSFVFDYIDAALN